MTQITETQVQCNPQTSFSAGLAVKEKVVSQGGFEAACPKCEFKPVPNTIHMVWVGSEPKVTQDEYLRQWAKLNPHHTVTLWVDSTQFGAYAANKEALAKAEALFPDFQAERPLRGLFSQLGVTLAQPGSGPLTASRLAEQNQAIKELDKELSSPGNERLKAILLGGESKVTARNAPQVLEAFKQHARRTDDQFFQAEAAILNQTTQAWDRSRGAAQRDIGTLESVRERFSDVKNVQIRDLSNTSDISLKNQDAYLHEIIGRNGGYAAASDIVRYEIVGAYGGTYCDIDLECINNLEEALFAHPDLMLVGLAQGKNEATNSGTPYFANALFSSHAGSSMLMRLVEHIGDQYQSMKGCEFSGDRYFSRPNKSTIEVTGPNALRSHVDRTIKSAGHEALAVRDDVASLSERIWDASLPQNKDFWRSVDSHFKFPDGLVNFETEEQQNSATKAMAGGAGPAFQVGRKFELPASLTSANLMRVG